MAVFGLASSLFFFAVSVFDHSPNSELSASPNCPNGIEFVPRPDEPKSSLIWVNRTNWEQYSNKLSNYLERYETEEVLMSTKRCDYDVPQGEDAGCYFDLKALGHKCLREDNFGYHKRSPCVLLALNTESGWVPEPYTKDDVLPDDMPEEVRKITRSFPHSRPHVWVSCEGEGDADKELLGPTMFYPAPGYPTYYFGYGSSASSPPPMVAVHFPAMQMGVVMFVNCRLWAKNIPNDQCGGVNFQMLMD